MNPKLPNHPHPRAACHALQRDLPHEMAAPDLRTLGRTDPGEATAGGEPYFGAHYRVSSEAGALAWALHTSLSLPGIGDKGSPPRHFDLAAHDKREEGR